MTVVVSFRMHKVVTPCNRNGYVSRRDSTNRRYASVTQLCLPAKKLALDKSQNLVKKSPEYSQTCRVEIRNKVTLNKYLQMSRSKVYQSCAHTHMLHNYFLQLLQVTSMVICEFRHDQVETRTVTFTSMTSRSKVYQSCAHTHICTCMSWS